MLGHAEARSLAAQIPHPASIQIYDRERDRALFKYRATVANAKAAYHAGIAKTWNAYGRPMTSAACGSAMAQFWRLYLSRLKEAGAALDAAPGLAYQSAALVWRFG